MSNETDSRGRERKPSPEDLFIEVKANLEAIQGINWYTNPKTKIKTAYPQTARQDETIMLQIDELNRGIHLIYRTPPTLDEIRIAANHNYSYVHVQSGEMNFYQSGREPVEAASEIRGFVRNLPKKIKN